MMMTRITTMRLGSRDQSKGHVVTVQGDGNSRCYCCFSVKTLIEGEKTQSHPTICDVFTLDITESISHGDNSLIWTLTPSRKGGLMRNLHMEPCAVLQSRTHLVQGLHFWYVWSLKVPLGHVLQPPAQTSTLFMRLPVTSKLTLCYM